MGFIHDKDATEDVGKHLNCSHRQFIHVKFHVSLWIAFQLTNEIMNGIEKIFLSKLIPEKKKSQWNELRISKSFAQIKQWNETIVSVY
jgi:hypothetical protein